MGKYEFKVSGEGGDCLWVVEVGKFYHILTIQSSIEIISYWLPGSLAQKNFKLFLTGLSANLSLYRKCTAWDSPGQWFSLKLAFDTIYVN